MLSPSLSMGRLPQLKSLPRHCLEREEDAEWNIVGSKKNIQKYGKLTYFFKKNKNPLKTDKLENTYRNSIKIIKP